MHVSLSVVIFSLHLSILIPVAMAHLTYIKLRYMLSQLYTTSQGNKIMPLIRHRTDIARTVVRSEWKMLLASNGSDVVCGEKEHTGVGEYSDIPQTEFPDHST